MVSQRGESLPQEKFLGRKGTGKNSENKKKSIELYGVQSGRGGSSSEEDEDFRRCSFPSGKRGGVQELVRGAM